MSDRPPTFDHQQKKPLERRVRVYLDDEPIETLEDARAALTEAETDAEQVYQRRLTLAKSASPTPPELLTIDDGLSRERDQALEPLRKAIADAEAAVLEASRVFVLRSPRIERDGKVLKGHRAFEELIAEHPPQDSDHDDSRRMTGRPEALARWHTDSFTPALLAACCVDPVLTVDEATTVYEDWTDGELGELVAAAFAVSQGARQVDVGKASRAASTRG
jgi:hypothetical protein